MNQVREAKDSGNDTERPALVGRELDAAVAEKWCNGCLLSLPLSGFNKCLRSKDGFNWRCRSCSGQAARKYARSPRKLAKSREWYYANSTDINARRKAANSNHDPKFKAWRREWNLKRKYGLTLDDYDRMLQAQGGRCAICGCLPNANGRPLDVDHCHTSKAVRGLLCDSCNIGLAKFKESVEVLERAAEYLSRTEVRKIA